MCVIGNDAKASVGGVFLHDPSQCHLCDGRHGIGFIQHNKLEAC